MTSLVDRAPTMSPAAPTPPPPPAGHAAILAAPAVDTAPPPTAGHGRRALIVGIDHTSGSRTLQGAIRDADTLQEALLAFGFRPEAITVLRNGEATRDRIVEELERFAPGPEDGRAVFAFAGHTRRVGGENHLIAADGRTIPAPRLAHLLSSVRTPLWVALPTCYAAGFRLPGIVGPDRVVTFASEADQRAYEATWYGRSFLFEYLVSEAMVNGRASQSVEHAFAFAHAEISSRYPNRVPLMDDGFAGDFDLGPPIPTPGAEALDVPEPRQADPEPSPRPEGAEDRGRSSGNAQVCTGYVRMGRCER